MIPHYNCVSLFTGEGVKDLHNAYIHQQQVRAYIRELMALPHLPANHIIPAFQQLKERCPRTNEKLLGLLSYFDNNWVNSTSRPPMSWSVFKRVVQMNNDISSRPTQLVCPSWSSAQGGNAAPPPSKAGLPEEDLPAPTEGAPVQGGETEKVVGRVRHGEPHSYYL